MCLLATAVYVDTMCYTYVGLMSMGQLQRPRPGKRIPALSKSVTSNIISSSQLLFYAAIFNLFVILLPRKIVLTSLE